MLLEASLLELSHSLWHLPLVCFLDLAQVLVFMAPFLLVSSLLFGGTNTQISGPTAPMTAVSMVIIAGIVAANDGDINKALPSILMVFLLAF